MKNLFMIDHTQLKLSKLEVATHQLSAAIELFLDKKDYLSSLTLAGAAEEILGKLLTVQGGISTLDFLKTFHFDQTDPSLSIDKRNKIISDLANNARNAAKHLNDDQVIVSQENALQMIMRAIPMCWKLDPECIQVNNIDQINNISRMMFWIKKYDPLKSYISDDESI